MPINKNKMDNLESKIEKLIDVIWRKIGQVDSKHLLMMSADLERIGNIDVKENTLLVSPKEKPSRITEYIQSAIAATAACLNNEVSPKDSEALCMEIIKDVDSLFELSHQYIFYWGLGLNEKLEDPDLCPLVLEAQEMYLVRGNRYQMFQERFFSNLLSIHNEIFLKEFDITAKDVISGIMSLEYALSQGRFQGFNRLQELYDLYLQRDSSDLESFSEEYIADIEKIKLETFSPEHYDVARITNWPEPLISQLSYEPGEAEWYEQGKYSKWPIVSLPIQSKPFIKLDDSYYCFDYYSLMDNLYRTIQKALIARDPSYTQIWQEKQQKASEAFVSGILSSLLPGCKVYTNNYYSETDKKGNLRENDIIVRFYDVLLIVEVKAGSVTYAPPITDWEAHVRNYKQLIENSDRQCAKTRGYLSCFEGDALLLDAKGKVKATIDMTRITDIFELTVTIDDINHFAAKAERLSFLNLESGAISISINDLMVYEDYFDSPFIFLHFLRERRRASRIKRAIYNDELDHLGMYIQDNCYTIALDEYKSSDSVFVMDQRFDLNEYYCQGQRNQLDICKPRQDYPRLYLDLFNNETILKMSNPVQFTSFLLDFSEEAREKFSQQIYVLFGTALARRACQEADYFSKADDYYGIRASCFVELDIEDWTDHYDELRNKAITAMLADGESSRSMIVLVFDVYGTIKDVHYELIASDGVESEKRQLLSSSIKAFAAKLVQEYNPEKRKVERNDPCPCGSGKKYKKCHGRNNC